jgi:RecJ-like exonuclease
LSYCVSHVKDIDGICSAALTRAATGAEVTLTDYGRILEDLRDVPPDARYLYICDLGVDTSDAEPFLNLISTLSRRTRLTYIDHHYLPTATKQRIRKLGVKLVHSEAECASILAYMNFKDILGPRFQLLALYGAVTDEMDHAPEASKLMEMTDK